MSSMSSSGYVTKLTHSGFAYGMGMGFPTLKTVRNAVFVVKNAILNGILLLKTAFRMVSSIQKGLQNF